MPNNRIDLSAHTWIEDMPVTQGPVAIECKHGYDHCPICDAPKRYLITKIRGVMIDWPEAAIELTVVESGDMNYGIAIYALADGWSCRIPLTDVAPVYAYVEGEPWAAEAEAENIGTQISCGSRVIKPMNSDWERFSLMHRRAVAVCDTAEQFRALHGELKEARDGND